MTTLETTAPHLAAVATGILVQRRVTGPYWEVGDVAGAAPSIEEIGRASCRERV